MNPRFGVIPLIVIATLAAAPLPAGSAPIERGLKFGLNLASFRGEFDELVGFQSKLGFTGGGFVAFPLSRVVAIQTGALFSMKGAKLVSEGTDPAGNPTGPFDTFVNLNYLELPILVRLTVPTEGMFEPSLFAGPNFGIKLSAQVKDEEPGASGSYGLSDVKPVDVGGTIGAGVRIGRGPVRYLASVQYATGFSDVYDIAGNLESINSVFSFTTGISF